MAQAFGLYTHQRNNRIRSHLLIAGLFVLAYLTSWGLMLIGYGHGGVAPGQSAFGEATRAFRRWFPVVTAITAAWIVIGFRINVSLIGAATGAKGITQADNPKLYRMLENLCISRGMPMPKLALVESDALNAFASGVNERQFTVTVTTGLLAQLDDAEIEAVLAHELTHIRNGDVRLMVIAVVIAGVISFVGEMVVRGLGRGHVRFSSGDSKKSNGAAVLAGVAVIAVAWLLAVLVRLSLSRAREYLADAGAVELTKNPDAMISALLKIAGRADLEGVPSGVMDMCFETDSGGASDLFSTHPSVTRRVRALIETAGGRMPAKPPEIGAQQDMGAQQDPAATAAGSSARGPWERTRPNPPAPG